MKRKIIIIFFSFMHASAPWRAGPVRQNALARTLHPTSFSRLLYIRIMTFPNPIVHSSRICSDLNNMTKACCIVIKIAVV
jgi:hypothetical protein